MLLQDVLDLMLFPVKKVSLRWSAIQEKRLLLRRAMQLENEINAKRTSTRLVLRESHHDAVASCKADARSDAARISALVQAYKRAASKVMREARIQAKLRNAKLVVCPYCKKRLLYKQRTHRVKIDCPYSNCRREILI